MASPSKLDCAIALLSLLLLLSSAHRCIATSDIHELLPLFSLPPGLLPREIQSYTYSADDNSFTVELGANPCYVTFDDQLVYYDRIIKGKLEFGKVSGVTGIQARKFFIWLSVTGMDVDLVTGDIAFHVGAITKTLPASDFVEVRSCKSKALREMLNSAKPEASI